jgi:drug/metabolite transporter (DMT)-like permease
MTLSYILVLQTYAIAHVSYAGAIREISVVFAAFIGWRWLGENFGLLRLVGASVIFVGILVIAIAG